MLPLNILAMSKGKDIAVELKNGDLYHGKLQDCDVYMNLHLQDVSFTAKSDNSTSRLPEIYLRGMGVKYVKFDESLIDDCARQIEADELAVKSSSSSRGRGRGRGGFQRGGRGRGNFQRGRGQQREQR
ncbi:hypothetical protein RCL1_005910 [Eukaryota sp. TZLM3-RCL]